MKCDKCQRELRPAPAWRSDESEHVYIGFFPCACDKAIWTDSGKVYPGDEAHEDLLNTGRYSSADLRSA